MQGETYPDAVLLPDRDDLAERYGAADDGQQTSNDGSDASCCEVICHGH